jgi:mycothiol synthase
VGGEPVGALTSNVWGDRGWVNEIGVLAPHRGRGIGEALLRRSFATFARRELQCVFLNVDAENPTAATALYERVGMRIVNRWDLWERPSGVSPFAAGGRHRPGDKQAQVDLRFAGWT